MNKKTRQYIGLLSALISYYVIHEGAHLLYALLIGVFKQIRFMGLGIQIDVFTEKMSDLQLGIFCISGAVATFVTAYILVLLTDKICTKSSQVLKACLYYITIAMLVVDPLYLGILSPLFGGGDMNGIMLLIPKRAAETIFIALLAFNVFVFRRVVYPKYTRAFQRKQSD